MSADRRINVPSRADFATTVEGLKAKHGVDELLAELVQQYRTEATSPNSDFDALVREVKVRIDPKLVDIMYEPMQARVKAK